MEKPQNNVQKTLSGYGHYSNADYLSWQLDEMVKLIRERFLGRCKLGFSALPL
ncbi:hypothetical protein [Cyclobacterium plantarum]|uniref:Uncharacterized protein n=1 Tax=Cyclobacterium plantarum TaxID=2716263 RepID=A0ABX0H5N6_9BACT|nr:hypothetical protein [Cyclobacterium plantarum]NHE57156.1 hypothetical protein [Cyclobacterium plantarum]